MNNIKGVKTRIIILILIAGSFSFFACNKNEPEEELNDFTTTYSSSSKVITNPERGFYRQITSYSEDDGVDPVFLMNLKDQYISLVLCMYYLEKFKDSPLSQKQLDLINADFGKLREAGFKCVLRFAYTNTMEGENATDAPIEMVETHIDQLKPILQENSDVIAFVQAGFIGAWGEWHSSTNDLTSTVNKKRIVNKLLDALPMDVMIQVRTPRAKQEVFETSEPINGLIAFSDDKRARVGHHNDCFMASTTDYGTYSNIALEKEYIHNEALFVPTGGETCPPIGIPLADCIRARNEMEYLRWTYLNANYYGPVIDNWNSQGCYLEFFKRLGYRIELIGGNFPEELKSNDSLKIELELSNTGFAPIYKNKITSLILKNRTTGTISEFKLNTDIRECRPTIPFIINELVNLNGIPEGIYDLYLKISDNSERLLNRPEYCIQLSNKYTWDVVTGLNSLKHSLVITN